MSTFFSKSGSSPGTKLCGCGCGLPVQGRRRFISGHYRSDPRHPNRLAAVTKHGLSGTREYNKFAQAKSRCNNPKNKRYHEYGGRGIKWLFESYERAYQELGPCPEGKTLDRINNDGNYEKGNVRWATKEEQYASRRPWNHARTPVKTPLPPQPMRQSRTGSHIAA
jgi:hypothetical protein